MKRTILILVVVAAVLGALAIRVVIEGRNALADGDDLMARDRPAEAIRAYESAARWYLPLAPHVDAAYAHLRGIAEAPDDERSAHAAQYATQPALRLSAWRAIRAAARATRSLWTPHAEDLAAADAAIARISAGVPQAATADEGWHRERLRRDSRPGAATAVIAGFGILLWLGGALGLVRRGFDPAGNVVRRVAAVAGLAMVVGMGCWAVGLYNA